MVMVIMMGALVVVMMMTVRRRTSGSVFKRCDRRVKTIECDVEHGACRSYTVNEYADEMRRFSILLLQLCELLCLRRFGSCSLLALFATSYLSPSTPC